MGYELEDENGELGFGLNIHALETLKTFFSKQEVRQFPVLADFLEMGRTLEPKLLAKECRKLLKISKVYGDESRFAFKELASASSKAGEILILVQ